MVGDSAPPSKILALVFDDKHDKKLHALYLLLFILTVLKLSGKTYKAVFREEARLNFLSLKLGNIYNDRYATIEKLCLVTKYHLSMLKFRGK